MGPPGIVPDDLLSSGSGSAAVRSIEVYDADGQHIGFFLGHRQDGSVEIFITSASRAMRLSKSNGESALKFDSLHYETSDCTGVGYAAAYAYSGDFMDVVGVEKHGGKFCMGLSGERSLIMRSVRASNGACVQIPSGILLRVHEVVEVPREEIPFQLPVALPLNYVSHG